MGDIAALMRAGRAGAMTVDEWAGLWDLTALPNVLRTTMSAEREDPDPTFSGLVLGAYLRNSVVFSCLAVRARLVAEARFQFQQLRGGRPGALFGTPDLTLLERPERGKTTRDLLATAMLDADLGGGGFVLRRPSALRRLRPDWTVIAYGSLRTPAEMVDVPGLGMWDPDADVIGYGYTPGGPASGAEMQTFLADEVAHIAPTKHPLARNLGISILTAGLREILADNSATTHKQAFFSNAATPNLQLVFPASMAKEEAETYLEMFNQEHQGAANGYRTIALALGVEAKPVGLNFQEMDFSKLQGRAETRIASLTGVHPVVVALSEGLQSSGINAPSYMSAVRLVGDATLHPLWGDIAGSFEVIVPPPPGTRLWYDPRDIPFLRQDMGDQATITKTQQETIGGYIKDGFTPASAIDAVVADDPARLVHTGLVSVQLQPPGTSLPSGGAATSSARPFMVGAARLRELLDEGWMPESVEDEAMIVRALVGGYELAGPEVGAGTVYRATVEFWAGEESLARLGPVAKGATLPPTHPLVRAFPSLFVAEPEDPAGYARRLRAQGLSAAAIAVRIDRTDRQVRRLLAEGNGAPSAPLSAKARLAWSAELRRLTSRTSAA